MSLCLNVILSEAYRSEGSILPGDQRLSFELTDVKAA
jgi:hypothetical protein